MGRYEERLRAVIALFNERGPEMFDDPSVLSATRAWIDPEIECVSAGGIQGGTYHGIDGLIEMVRDFTSAWSELQFEIGELEETEDSLITTMRYHARGASSGVPIVETYVWAQRYEDGKAVSYAIDRDREGAVRAAGLAP